MRSLVTISVVALCATATADDFVIRGKIDGGDFVIREKSSAKAKRSVIVYSQHFNQCHWCLQMFGSVGHGDDDVEVTWEKENLPAWVTGTPAIFDVRTGRRAIGAKTMVELKQWLAQDTQAMKPQAAAAAPKPVAQSGYWTVVRVCDVNRRGRMVNCRNQQQWVPAN